MHLLFDGLYGSRKNLGDKELLVNVANELVARMEMTRIDGPHVYELGPCIQVVTVIAESHIIMHCYPEERRANIDVFSCKKFDIYRTINYLNSVFGFGEHKHREVERGLETLSPES